MTDRDSSRRDSGRPSPHRQAQDRQAREFTTVDLDDSGPACPELVERDGAIQAATFTHTLTDAQRLAVINAELRMVATAAEAARPLA